jgi:hypothetical protein
MIAGTDIVAEVPIDRRRRRGDDARAMPVTTAASRRNRGVGVRGHQESVPRPPTVVESRHGGGGWIVDVTVRSKRGNGVPAGPGAAGT